MATGSDGNAGSGMSGMEPANDAGQDEEMLRRRQQYRLAQERMDSIVPGNGSGVHVNGAEAHPDPARERRIEALRARERELAEEIERNKDKFYYPKAVREESLAKTRSMLSDLEAGRSRGVFSQIDDAVVTGVDAFGEGAYDVGAGAVGLGKQTWNLGGELVSGDFKAAGERLGRGVDAVKSGAADAYDAVVNKPWFQGTRDAWSADQYGAAVGGVAPDIAGAAGIVKGGARKLLRGIGEGLEDPPMDGNNSIKKRSSEKGKGDNSDPEKKGEPVVAATGEYVERWQDLAIEGTIFLSLTRFYGAHWDIIGPFGRNRTCLFDTTLTVTPDNKLLYRDEQGRRIFFDRPFNLSSSTNDKYRNLSLRSPWLNQLILENGRLNHHFSQGDDYVYRLDRIEDRDGNFLSIERDQDGLITVVRHSDGYSLRMVNDQRGRRCLIELLCDNAKPMRVAEYQYDAEGNLLSADCEVAFSVKYQYDKKGRLTEWVDSSRRSTVSFQYDESDRVLRTNTSGPWNKDVFEYDHENGMVVYRPGGGEAFERLAFDDDHNLLWEENALGEKRSFTYESGYRTSVSDGNGNTQHFTYDHFGNVTSHKDGEGRITLYRWGTRGELDIIIDHAGNSYTNQHDERGHIISSTDPLGNVTKFEWDVAGRLIRTVFADGCEELRRYDRFNRLVEIVGPNRSVTAFTRDAIGRVIKVEDANGKITRYIYDHVKGKHLYAPTAIHRPDGAIVRYGYDTEGLLTYVVDGEGNITRYENGAFDRLKSVTNPLGGVYGVEYDVRGSIIRVTNPLGFSYEYERDLAGRVCAEVDFEGRRTIFKFDKGGRVVCRIAPDGTQQRMTYDRSDRILAVAGHELDESGGICEEPYETESFEYDERGLLAKASNSSTTIVFERDRIGRVVAENQNQRRISSVYNSRGYRVRREIGFSPGWTAVGPEPTGFQGITPEDIQAGRILNPPRLEPAPIPLPDSVTHYGFDVTGLISQLLIGVDSTGIAQDTLTFHRDALGREIARENGRGFSLYQRFDALGLLAEQRVIGSVNAANGAIVRTTAGSVALLSPSNVSGVAASSPAPADTLAEFTRAFEYNKSLAPISVSDDLWGQSSFDYDANGQVIRVTHNKSLSAELGLASSGVLSAGTAIPPIGVGEEDSEIERFVYDVCLNVEASETSLPSEPLGRQPLPWLTVSGGGVKAARGPAGERIFLTHDACGRVIERRIELNGFRPRTWRFEWNSFNRLKRCVTPEGARWDYIYDPFGRRLEKRLINSIASHNEAANGNSNVGSVRFVWDGTTIAEQIPMLSSGEIDLSRRVIWHHEPSNFRPIARESASGEIHYVVTDHLGTPRECVSADGVVEWAAHYRLWGGVRNIWRVKQSPVRTAASGDASWTVAQVANRNEEDFCPIRFPGQWEDAESQLYYNRFRIYDPITASYLSPDPIGLEGGARPGAYVASPTTWIDPLGLEDAPGTILYPLNSSLTPQSGSYSAGINRAWSLERQLVQTTGSGTVNWTPSQANELLTTGRVTGFTGHHINNAAQYPEWEADPRNIRFLQNGREGLPNDHLYSDQGHRGNWQNETSGRLIDRQAMIDRHLKQKERKKCG